MRVRARRPYSIDLTAHLAMCETNYSRFVRLFPRIANDEPSVFRVAFAQASTDAEPDAVTFEVLARDRYTSVVALCQRAPDQQFAATRIKVRLYHDARCAEVIEFQGERRFESVYPYPNEQMRHPDEKAQVNRFLAEFLNICLTRGVVCHESVAVMDS